MGDAKTSSASASRLTRRDFLDVAAGTIGLAALPLAAKAAGIAAAGEELPEDWGGDLPEGKLPRVPLQFDPNTGQPKSWPLRYAIAHWAAIIEAPPAGRYDLRCRAVDANGIAQPLPRPLPKSGNNAIQKLTLTVEA